MNEPSQPFLYFNYYDILILVFLIFLFIFFSNKRLKSIDVKIIRVIKIILVLVVIPMISVGIEIDLVVNKNGIDDSFTLLYTYLKIPLWWLIGIILVVYGSFINNNK